jgi:hypothetical protein
VAFTTQNQAQNQAGDGPVTLHAVMKDAVGYGLRFRYQPENEIPHELLVLLMQMKENERRAKAAN